MEADLEKVPRLGWRHLQAALLFIGLAANTILQLNVGVTVVAMTNATSINEDTPVVLQLDGVGEVLHPVQLLLGLHAGSVPRRLPVQALRLEGRTLPGHPGLGPAQCGDTAQHLCGGLAGLLPDPSAPGPVPGDMALHPPAFGQLGAGGGTNAPGCLRLHGLRLWQCAGHVCGRDDSQLAAGLAGHQLCLRGSGALLVPAVAAAGRQSGQRGSLYWPGRKGIHHG
ncbi:uncharacterized protein LOC111077338 isoform X2 [Drosophila obscura]|uniref:uncharacterized protein LOC111077338 isoform X2 n=1 Tax=Drosophila obscura TaxID=7282 RepID=UPI001BB175DD|nr:uncharacterized protein LOC111077338 isoform X2 [Drosophila obscura]